MTTQNSKVNQYIEQLQGKYGDLHNESVTPYQRVNDAIERRQPDRVPYDFWGVPETIEKMQTATGFYSKESLLQLLGVDCRTVQPDYIGPEIEMEADGTYYDTFGRHCKKVSNEYSTYNEYVSFPLAHAKTTAEVESYQRWPDISIWDWASLRPMIDELNQNTRFHIRYDVGGIFENSWELYGLDKFLMDLVLQPEIPLAIMDCVTNILIANFRVLMEYAGDLIDMVRPYDDVAVQNGLMMSKKMWRQYIMPFHQKLNAELKKYDVKILYHSCGAIYDLIDSFIDDMHIDVLNPLQPRAAKMDMQKIKDNFGDRVSFHGAIDLQETLPHGTVEDVQEEVRERCRILGQGGGYICTSAHYIQADTPVKNILAMYAADRTVQ